jgi:hypothetical protein
MDRLIQGIEDETGRPFVLFGKVKITTLPDGRYRVEDQRGGGAVEVGDREAALKAAGVEPAAWQEPASRSPEAPIVAVRGLINEVEARALRRIAARRDLTEEATVRRAVAEFILKHDV